MRPSLSLLLGLRFSCTRHQGSMVSLISILSTFSIALGVIVMITGLSAMNGFERELNRRILAVVPHGEIEAVNQPFQSWKSMVSSLEKVSGISAAVPYINFTGLIESGAKIEVLQLKGIDPIQEPRLSDLPRFVADDAWSSFTAGRHQIILGSGLARKLNVKKGDKIIIIIPNNNDENKLLQPKRIRLQVHSILQLSGILDYSLALIPLADAKQYLDMGDSVTGIALKMYNPFLAEELVKIAGKVTQSHVYIKSWISTYGYMYRDIQVIRTIMYLAMVLVIGVASFNIVSTLVMAIKEKIKDIAVLRTLGAKDCLIRAVFIWYGLLAGLFGSLIGVVMGILVALNLTSLMYKLESLSGHHFLVGSVYFIDFLPSELRWLDVLSVLLTAMILSLLASWYPAYRASRIEPARVLSRSG